MTKLINILKAIILLMRPHHWIKNVFVLVPAFFARELVTADVWLQVFIAFGLFCLTSSAVYIFNDLRDFEADKQHAKKKFRPLPSGMISKNAAVIWLFILVAVVLTLLATLHLPWSFSYILFLYTAINVLYTLGLKQFPILEIFLLSSGYVLRLFAGSLVSHETLSGWIIISTGLVAFLMTVGKRRADLVQENDKDMRRSSLRHYTINYLDQIIAMLAAATLVTYLLFCISDYATARFGSQIIWSAVFVLYGLMRYMQLLMVQQSGDQPVTLLYRDRQMIVTIGLFALFFVYSLFFRHS